MIDVSNLEDASDKLLNEFPGTKIILSKTDVSQLDQVKSALNNIYAQFGAIDLVANCAGIVNEHSVEKTIAVNLVSFLSYLSKYQIFSYIMYRAFGLYMNLDRINSLYSNCRRAHEQIEWQERWCNRQCCINGWS